MYQNIVFEPASKIREIARNVLSGNWTKVCVGFLIYFLLTDGVTSLLGVYFSTETSLELWGRPYTQFVNNGGGIYEFVLGGPLMLGATMFVLSFFRTKKADNTLLFEGFSRFGKSFLLALYQTVLIFLWSLLFVIPGIVAFYRYRLSYYIMVDHPEYSVSQCVDESKRLMMGNKGRLFGLDLSFIGWYILASLPLAIYEGTMELGEKPTLVSVLISIVFSLPLVVVLTYMSVSRTAFYELATRRLVVFSPNAGNVPFNNGANNYGDVPHPTDNNAKNDFTRNAEADTAPKRDIDREPENSRDLD